MNGQVHQYSANRAVSICTAPYLGHGTGLYHVVDLIGRPIYNSWPFFLVLDQIAVKGSLRASGPTRLQSHHAIETLQNSPSPARVSRKVRREGECSHQLGHSSRPLSLRANTHTLSHNL